MAETHNQHYLFSYEAMPIMFHSQSKDFLRYLDRDGIGFLKFWWDMTGNKVDAGLRSEPKGLGFQLKAHPDGRKIVLITLPAPKDIPEAYFLELVSPPVKRGLFSWQNSARVFSLEKAARKDGTPVTALAEWTARGYRHLIGKGPEPLLEDFYQAVDAIITKK